MRATDNRTKIARIVATESGSELELTCGACGHVFIAYQHYVCGLPLGYHDCTKCGETTDLFPDQYEGALHAFMPPRAANPAGFSAMQFMALAPTAVERQKRKSNPTPRILFAPAHANATAKFHGELSRRFIALHRRVLMLRDALGGACEFNLRPDPTERARRGSIVDEMRLRDLYAQWADNSGCTAPLFVDGPIEDELAYTDLLITHVGAPWIDAALKAGIEVFVLPLLPNGDGERVATGARAIRDAQLEGAVNTWLEERSAPPVSEPVLPVELEPRDGDSLRILCAYREDVDGDGGAAVVMRETIAGLRGRGHEVDVTYDLDPDVRGYDLVHCFNIWNPKSALPQIKNIKRRGAAVLWSPIFLDLSEMLWAAPFLLAWRNEPKEKHEELWRLFESGELTIGSLGKSTPNEIDEGFFEQIRDTLELVDHVCVTSFNEVKALMQRSGAINFPFSVVPHGVKAEAFKNATGDLFEETFGLRDFVLCVGALDRRKNQIMILEALRETDLQVVLIGPSFEHDYVAGLEVAATDNVHILWRQSQAMVASALKAAAVHVLPSFCEGAALANLEAAVAECPMVVSNRSSEFEYFFDGAYYCDPTSRESIRESVLRAINENDKRARARKLLAQRIETLCDWDRTAEMTEAIYRSMVPDRA